MLESAENISSYSRANLMIWIAMSFQAGTLNIGGFLACHRFVSHVTGFAAFLGVEVANKNYWQAAGMLLVPLFFLLGVMLSAQLIEGRIKAHRKPQYHLTFFLIFAITALIFGLGVQDLFGVFGEPFDQLRDYLLLTLLCLVCGIQNGAVTMASHAVVRTTHLTGVTTDLGLGIVRMLAHIREKQSIEVDLRANITRLAIIFGFGCGSVIGAIVFKKYGYWGFLMPTISSAILFLLVFYYRVLRFLFRLPS